MKRLTYSIISILAIVPLLLYGQTRVKNGGVATPVVYGESWGGVDSSGIARPLIGMNSSGVSIDPAARGTTIGGTLAVTGAQTFTGALTVTTIKSPLTSHLDIQTQSNNRSVRLNSRTITDTVSGDVIGFQSKPRLGITSANQLYGGQVSAQVSDGIAMTSASGTVIGLHSDVYLRGTSAGTIAGDVRGLQIEMTTDDAGTRTISGYVAGIRIRSVFSATAITGNFVPIRIEAPESQTGSQTYDAVLDLTGTVSGVWDDSTSSSGDTEAGIIKVIVNGNARYIVLYSDN